MDFYYFQKVKTKIMNKKHILSFHIILILILFGFSVSYSQSLKLSDDPNQFILDANTMMVNSKNPKAIKAGSDLQTAWGAIGDKQKKMFISISQQMIKKKCKTRQ